MASFWDQVRKIFQSAEESSPTNPVVHTLIERTEEDKKQFARWRESYVSQQLFDWLTDQYALYRTSDKDVLDDAIDFLDTPSTKGFVVYFHQTQYSLEDATFFSDLLKERVLKLNYRTQISDTRTFNREKWVETIERHYLKPRSDFQPKEKFDQQFGNITIQQVLRNHQPHHVRFGATVYHDSMFEKAEEFQDLMQRVLYRGQ